MVHTPAEPGPDPLQVILSILLICVEGSPDNKLAVLEQHIVKVGQLPAGILVICCSSALQCREGVCSQLGMGLMVNGQVELGSILMGSVWCMQASEW